MTAAFPMKAGASTTLISFNAMPISRRVGTTQRHARVRRRIHARRCHDSAVDYLFFVRPMNARIATAILLAACPFATALADTKVVLPHSQRFADTGRDFLLETTIPGDFKTLEGIVWGLLTLSSQCPDKQFSSYFFPDAISSTSPGEGAQPLYMYFRGLRRDGRKVILRFTGDANRYLNNTAAIQELVKGPLEATIRLHTNKSTTVYYEIDGEIVEEWDA